MKNLKNLILKDSSTIKEVLEMLKLNGEKNLVVVDKNKKFLGTISDGDIRKALIEGKKLSNKITKYYQKNSYFFYENNYTIKEIKTILSGEFIGVIPIIDKQKNIKEIYCRSDFYKNKKIKKLKANYPVVIMAGGIGSRLQPLTDIIPKPLIPINKKTLIENLLDKFYAYGLNKFYLTINFKSELIKTYFSYTKLKYIINFVKENKPLGTAGSLKLLQNKLKKTFFVSNCDTLLNIDYGDLIKFHKKGKYDLTIITCKKQFKVPYGVCELNLSGNLKNIIEKPQQEHMINVGFYVLEPNIISLIKKNQYLDFNELINKSLKSNKKIGVFPIDLSDWQDIGTNNEYINFLKNLDVK